jgi:Ca2+-binding RTX toxin-like protein
LAGTTVESLTLLGTANIDGAGNTLANTIIGNSGDNVISGGNGADVIGGETGNDTLDGGAGLDTIIYRDKFIPVVVDLKGATGASVSVGGVVEDTIKNFENVIGGHAGDTLTGDGLANLLSGGLGNDLLAGNGGPDTFPFRDALNAATNVDHIEDFTSEDSIALDDGVFTGIRTAGTLSADAFFSADGATSAHDADDRIVYNTTTGALFFDADGIGGGAAVEFAVLDNHAALTNADFVVV